MIGQKLNNRYIITSLLGEGGMGEVYLATDEQTKKQVAVKILARQLTSQPESLERFRREAETLRQLDHPNIVKFVDAFEHERQYIIVMEYVSGGSLQDLIKQGQLPIERVQQITLDLCDALIRAHRLNIIHRDIKPENVLITEDGTPKLADFGVARLSEGTRMTRSGTQVGTPYYMSPEAWEGKTLDAQADIWSLGVMLFEMLTGQVPFGGDTGAAVMNKVLTAQPPDLKKLRADVPSKLTRIIPQMLTRDKKRRYPTMREVAVELERGQEKSTVKSESTSLPIAPGKRPNISNPKVAAALFGMVAIIIAAVLGLPQLTRGFEPDTIGTPVLTLTAASTLNPANPIGTASPSSTETITSTAQLDLSGTQVSKIPLGNALQIIDATGHGRIPYSSNLNLRTEITLEAWVKVERFPPNCRKIVWANSCGYMAVIGQGYQDSSAGNFTLAVGQKGLLFAFIGADSRLMAYADIAENEWTHVAISHTYGDGSGSVVYLNGEPITDFEWVDDAARPISGNDFPWSNAGADYYVGQYGIVNELRGQGEHFIGEIDELRIWQIARTQDDIIDNMNSELSGEEAGLVSYWDFNIGPNETIVPDRSGNGQNIRLNGNFEITQGALVNPSDTSPTENERVYLATLTPSTSQIGFFSLGIGKYPFSEGPFVDGNVISANGVEYKYGLFAHAPSQLSYSLDKKYSIFSSKIFIDGYDTCSGSAEFKVVLDGVEIFRSEVLTYNFPVVEPVDVQLDVSGGETLSLITDSLGDLNCDMTIWGDPYLIP